MRYTADSTICASVEIAGRLREILQAIRDTLEQTPPELASDVARDGILLAGGVPQSYVDLDDPLHLELEYMRQLGHLIDLAAPAGVPLRVLHLGAGALTLARYVAATRPGSGLRLYRATADSHWILARDGQPDHRIPVPLS